METKTLTPELLQQIDAYWRAANYLSVGQIYLYDNPLLKRPLTLADVKHMLLGHWGTTPGQNFIYAHLNRVIKKYDLDMIYVSGPGHGGPAVVGNTYLEGTYSEIYPDISQDEAGLRKLFHSVFVSRAAFPATPRRRCPARSTRAASWAIRSAILSGRCSTIPISSSPASSAMARRKPDRWPRRGIPTSFSIRPPMARCCRSCISTATRFPIRPCSPASPARNWNSCCAATAGRLISSKATNRQLMHEAMAATLDTAVEQIKQIQQDARVHGNLTRPRWPMIVLNSPKGWTGPKVVDGLQVEGTFRAHQVPLSDPATHPEHLKLLEDWLRSYRPEELFDEQGRLKPELAELAPKGERRMGANPHANGGMLLRDLRMPDFRDYAEAVPAPGVRGIGDAHVLGPFLRDVAKLNNDAAEFPCLRPG